MALDAPYYLAIGEVILETGDGTGPYFVSSMSFPAPDPDGLGGWLPAIRTVTLKVTGTSAAGLTANIAALRRAAVRDSILAFRPTLTGGIECRIREASVVEDDYDPLRRSGSSTWAAYLTVTLTTDPYWLGPWSAETTITLDSIPGHFDIADPGGEVPALLRLRLLPKRYAFGLAIGLKPDPGASYDYLDEYGISSEVSDANASGTYKKAYSLTGTLGDVASAHVLDTNDNRGRHLVIARLDNDAASQATVSLRAGVTTTGSAIAVSSSVYEHVVTPTSGDLVGHELGDVLIPAVQVPQVHSSSAWSAEVEGAKNNTTTTSLQDLAMGFSYQSWTQTLRAQVTSVRLKLKNSTAHAVDGALAIYRSVGDAPSGSAIAWVPFTLAGSHDGWKLITLQTPLSVYAGQHYIIAVREMTATDDMQTYYSTDSAYAGGKYTPASTGNPSATDDIYFVVFEKVTLEFDSRNYIQASCSESGKTLHTDYVQRIPLDYGCLVYRLTASGDVSLYYDGETETPYACDADGIGGALYDKCEIRHPLRPHPGVTTRVVIGLMQPDTVVDGSVADGVKYQTRPRFLTATG